MINKLKLILSCIILLAQSTLWAQNLAQTNPLLIHSNAPIRFDKVNAKVIEDAVHDVLAISDKRINTIAAIPAGKANFTNTMMAFDELQYDLSDLSAKIGLVTSTYADNATRDTANVQAQVLSSYISAIYLNQPLYKAVKHYSLSLGARQLTAVQQKYLRETVTAFEVNGMKLDQQGRDKLKLINDKIIAFGNQFDTNIAEYKDSVAFTQAELKDVPPGAMASWKRADGSYMVTINGPNLFEIIENCSNQNTRRIIYTRYMNRGYPKNITALDSLFFYRQKLADQLGYKTYAQYALVTKMAAKPENVWNFENDLKDKLSPHVGPELDLYRDLKKQLHTDVSDTLQAWDVNYYRGKLLNNKYGVNPAEVKQYFEMNNTVQGMFMIYQKLFGISIHEVKGLPSWDAKIKAYQLDMDGKKMGTFFLDLFPRPNKYTHFETAPIAQYRKANGKVVLPVGALICNFPEGSATEPSLLEHEDVITMFHEFGHLIHFLVGQPLISSQNLNGIKGDFTEAPSQFLENFCWNYDCLKLFAKNYKTGKILPKALFDKMKAAENVGIGIQYMRQVSLGMLDFTYEDRYNEIKDGGILKVSKDIWQMNQIPFPENTHFICAFNHLNGYGANYYGYLWSKVYAQDMFSVFEQHGVLDQATGIRYRKLILEPGAQREEMDMLRNFLGREPKSAAFLKSLGI